MRTRERGATLVVGLLLLSLVTLLGLAGANGAHVETLLVQNEEAAKMRRTPPPPGSNKPSSTS